jgi:hypothetical protein
VGRPNLDYSVALIVQTQSRKNVGSGLPFLEAGGGSWTFISARFADYIGTYVVNHSVPLQRTLSVVFATVM